MLSTEGQELGSRTGRAGYRAGPRSEVDATISSESRFRSSCAQGMGEKEKQKKDKGSFQKYIHCSLLRSAVLFWKVSFPKVYFVNFYSSSTLYSNYQNSKLEYGMDTGRFGAVIFVP